MQSNRRTNISTDRRMPSSAEARGERNGKRREKCNDMHNGVPPSPLMKRTRCIFAVLITLLGVALLAYTPDLPGRPSTPDRWN
jgi:hypothetical protein